MYHPRLPSSSNIPNAPKLSHTRAFPMRLEMQTKQRLICLGALAILGLEQRMAESADCPHKLLLMDCPPTAPVVHAFCLVSFASLWPSKLLFPSRDMVWSLSANMDYRKGAPLAAVQVEALVHLLFPSPKIFLQRKYPLTRRREFRWP